MIDSGFFGDAVHLVPALHEVRRHYPQAELHVLTTPIGAQVICLAQCADRLWPLEQTGARRTLAAQLKTLSALRSLRFDASINFGVSDRPLIYAGLIRAGRRLGRQGGRRHFWKSWCVHHQAPETMKPIPVFESHREMLSAAGFSLAPARFDLKINPADAIWASEQAPGTVVHLSPNSMIALKEWAVSYWAELVRLIRTRHPELTLVATGTSDKRELERLDALLQATGDAGVKVVSNASIPQLAALISKCCVHVGSDSGALHLAVALGVPTVLFFRDNPGIHGWMPTGPANWVLVRPCVCVNQRRASCDAQSGPRCLGEIRPEEVMMAIEQIMASRGMRLR